MSKSIGITFPTVTKAVASLLDAKLLEEYEDAPNGPGRPAKRLRLASENAQVIGVTLSESVCWIASAGLDGVIHEPLVEDFETPDDYDSLIEAIATHATKLIEADDKATLCVGVSIPGIVDYQQQLAVMSANLPMVNGKHVGRDLQAKIDVECIVVRDAHAFSLSERLTHNGGDARKTIAMLDHSEGIGLGLIINREFFTGEKGYAGELGHIPIVSNGEVCHCGKVGCLETVASEWSLEVKFSKAFRRPVSIDEILELATAGDDDVLQALNEMCAQLARGLACVVNIFNPGIFYIYGKCFQAAPQLLEVLTEETRRHALAPSFTACEFLPASGGELEGTVASVVNYLTESLVPDLDSSGALSGN
jgi:N-acetylglucosamine repressor